MGHRLDILRSLSNDKRAKDSHLLLAQMIADGFELNEVLPYLMATPTRRQREAATYMADHLTEVIPWFDNLVTQLVSNNRNTIGGEIVTPTSSKIKAEDDDDLDASSKESVIMHLKAQYKVAKDPKQKTEILMKIADLQKMKQDEVKDEQKHMMVYLPATCHDCPALALVQKEHPDVKPLSSC